MDKNIVSEPEYGSLKVELETKILFFFPNFFFSQLIELDMRILVFEGVKTFFPLCFSNFSCHLIVIKILW